MGKDKKKRKKKKGIIGAAAAAVVVAAGVVTSQLATNESSIGSIELSGKPAVSYSVDSDINADIEVINDTDEADKAEIAEKTDDDTDKASDADKTDAEEKSGGTDKSDKADTADTAAVTEYHFRIKNTLSSHFEKHGGEFNGQYKTAAEYEAGASKVANDPTALHKLEAEDGDDVYYIKKTNEFVIVSKDGYIRTYFKPSAGKKYYDRQ